MTTLMLGEALVDLACEQPVARLAEAPGFAPRFGGSTARTAVHAARLGADVALAGGVGDDDWGDWLRGQLELEGVDLTWFRLVADERTPIAFRTVDGDGAGATDRYGPAADDLLDAVRPRIAEAVDACDGLHLSAGVAGRRDTAAAALVAARDLGRPLSVELGPGDDAESATELLAGALLVVAGPRVARTITGEEDADAAAAVLVDRGARMAVVTDLAGGAALRGAGVDRRVRGAAPAGRQPGPRLVGALVAALELSDRYPAAVAAALPGALAPAAG